MKVRKPSLKMRRLYQQRFKEIERNKVAKRKTVKRFNNAFKKAAEMQCLDNLRTLFRPLSRDGHNFLIHRIKKNGEKKTKRRFTVDDKIVAVSFLKGLRGQYRNLKRHFRVPSISSLKKLLLKSPYKPGLNIILQKHMEPIMGMWPISHRHCVLLFERVALKPHLTLDMTEDEIWGFQNFGTDRRPAFAENALVFMLCGVSSFLKWKLPYAFMFIGGTTETSVLVQCIKQVLSSAASANFNVVATVCDQDRMNVAAIKSLKSQTQALCKREWREFREECFEFEGREIVHIWDPLQLLREFRNNFRTKDMTFTMDGEQYTASWADLIQFYKYDNRIGMPWCPLLKEHNVMPCKIRKTDARCVVKVFDRKVNACIANMLIERPPEQRQQSHGLGRRAAGTAKLVLFLDELFDSVNGARDFDYYTRPLRNKLSANSVHWEFWEKAKPILRSMKFVQQNGNEVPFSFTNWMATLNGIQYLWKSLANLGFTSLELRVINQDPLTNLIGNIRSHLGSKRYPTAASFVSSFRALSMNNFVSAHSAQTKYDNNPDEFLFARLKSFRTAPISLDSETETDSETQILQSNTARKWSVPRTAYVAEYVAKRIIKLTNVTTCETCTKLLLSTDTSEHDLTLKLTLHRLTRPRTMLINHVKIVMDKTFLLLPRIGHQKCVLKRIVNAVMNDTDLTRLTCGIHNIARTFVECTVKFSIFVWCRRTNRLLTGRGNRSRNVLDPIHKLAVMRYKKSLRNTHRL